METLDNLQNNAFPENPTALTFLGQVPPNLHYFGATLFFYEEYAYDLGRLDFTAPKKGNFTYFFSTIKPFSR